METALIYTSIAIGIATLILLIALLRRQRQTEKVLIAMWEQQRAPAPATDLAPLLRDLRADLSTETRESRRETTHALQQNFQTITQVLHQSQKETADAQDRRLRQLDETLKTTTAALRDTVEKRLAALQEDNHKQLETMRQTVDEKLQKTLEERLAQSFRTVNEHLEQVHKGLGEMQTLASGVGDLKRVLTNVKTRGIIGEIQLASILEEILSPEQFDRNVAVKKHSQERVEFAVRLPGRDDSTGTVHLPIDSKFPIEDYQRLLDAYENGNAELIAAAGKDLERTVKTAAKTIHDKYISPPETTDFAVMFLPVEGLYAEVIRRGLVEILQREYHVNIAGPTTMAALLNSLQMGFKTLAIEKRSAEVWQVLAAVKTEFATFGKVLQKTQQRLTEAHNELEKLVGTRTRKIQIRLNNVMTLPTEDAQNLLGTTYDEEEEKDEDHE